MTERWAALLANAAAGGRAAPVRPSFVAILREIGPDEAFVVDWLYDPTNNPRVPRVDDLGRGLIIEDAHAAREHLGLGGDEFQVVTDNVVRLGLAARPLESGAIRYDKPPDVYASRERLARTSLGQAFVRACTAP